VTPEQAAEHDRRMDRLVTAGPGVQVHLSCWSGRRPAPWTGSAGITSHRPAPVIEVSAEPAESTQPPRDTREPAMHRPRPCGQCARLSTALHEERCLACRTGTTAPVPAEQPECTRCGQPLLLAQPGRTVCERCRLDRPVPVPITVPARPLPVPSVCGGCGKTTYVIADGRCMTCRAATSPASWPEAS
jgi:hypothetical protein